MERSRWILLAVTASWAGLSVGELQKVLFILGQEMAKEVGEGFYEFAPGAYGPSCSEIYVDADALVQQGLLIHANAPVKTWVPLPIGTAIANDIRQGVPESAVRFLGALITWAGSLEFTALVGAVNAGYPQYARNTVFAR